MLAMQSLQAAASVSQPPGAVTIGQPSVEKKAGCR